MYQRHKCSIVEASMPMSNIRDKNWLQDKHLITYLQEIMNLHIVVVPLAWKYFARAIVRRRDIEEAKAKKSKSCS